MVADLQGKPCALVLAAGESRPAHGGLLTINVETGELYDRFPWRARKYESVLAQSPLVLPGGRVFFSECYEKGGKLIELGEDFEVTGIWENREFGMHWMMPVIDGGYLYGFAGRNTPDTAFKCIPNGNSHPLTRFNHSPHFGQSSFFVFKEHEAKLANTDKKAVATHVAPGHIRLRQKKCER